MNKSGFSLWAICAAATLLLALSSALNAKTPDGQPPSEETVCDQYEGALFGLCNAYCEAHDCGDPEQASSDRSCQRIRENFMRHSDGIPPACGLCPCFSAEDITAGLTDATGDVICGQAGDDGPFDTAPDQMTGIGGNGNFYLVASRGDPNSEGARFCDGSDPVSMQDDLSLEEANACRETIRAVADVYCNN